MPTADLNGRLRFFAQASSIHSIATQLITLRFRRQPTSALYLPTRAEVNLATYACMDRWTTASSEFNDNCWYNIELLSSYPIS